MATYQLSNVREMRGMIDETEVKLINAEQKIKELELELAAVKGENAGLRLGLEAMKSFFPQYQLPYQPAPVPWDWTQPMQPVLPIHPPIIPSPVNPAPWWTQTTNWSTITTGYGTTIE
jgi:hypothetical protein